MAILSFFANDDFNIDHVIVLSVVHDMCETITCDITPIDNVSYSDTFKLEASDMHPVGIKFQNYVNTKSKKHQNLSLSMVWINLICIYKPMNLNNCTEEI